MSIYVYRTPGKCIIIIIKIHILAGKTDAGLNIYKLGRKGCGGDTGRAQWGPGAQRSLLRGERPELSLTYEVSSSWGGEGMFGAGVGGVDIPG